MSEPSNGAWPFQEIPEEEGLDISAIFGDSSAAPQGDPFAPPAAAQSVPSSPTPVAQEITPAVAATSQPTTAPIAKAPVEAPAENPIAAAFEQKTAENTKKGLLEKPPVFYHKGVKEEIDDPSMTFEELRIRKSDDFTDLEEGKRVSWSVEYCGIRKEVKDPKGTTIISMKEMIERSREFLDALKKTKDKDPCCYVKPKVEMKTKGNAAYKGKFGTLEEARNSDSGRWQRSGADDSCAVAHFAAKRRAAPRLRDLLCRPRACGRISRGTAGDSVKPCRICPLRRAAQPGGGKR